MRAEIFKERSDYENPSVVVFKPPPRFLRSEATMNPPPQ